MASTDGILYTAAPHIEDRAMTEPWNNACWHAFTRTGIETNAPAQSGVYAIRNGQTTAWIYIGEADDIRGRLMEHHTRASEPSACIWQQAAIPSREPLRFSYETVEAVRRNGREDELVGLYRPTCNRPPA